jgi:hypothetical protein
MFERMFSSAHESLADRRTHRTTQETEFERARNNRQALQRSRHHDQRIFLLCRFLRL